MRVAAVFGPNAFVFGDYYNQMALGALVQTSNEVGSAFDVVVSPQPEAIAQDIESCIKLHRYDLIIAVGNAMQAPLEKCAKSFPGERFALVDGSLEGTSNVISYSSDARDISFLCGRVAAKLTKSADVGCILWSDNWVARDWIQSFIVGAKSARPASGVYFSYGPTAEQAYEKADLQFRKGAGIIMCHAGSSDLGIIKAAKEHGRYVLGFLNERRIDEDHVLLDVVRDMKPILCDAFRRITSGKFEGGKLVRIGLREGGFGLDLDNAHRTIGLGEKRMVRETIEEIKAGHFDSELSPLKGGVSLAELGGTLI